MSKKYLKSGTVGEGKSVPKGGTPLGLPYKVYVAKLSQSLTADPTAVVLENTLGEEVTWTRAQMGRFFGSIPSGFVRDKTVVITFASGTDATATGLWWDADNVAIVQKLYATGADTDQMYHQYVEIRVYE